MGLNFKHGVSSVSNSDGRNTNKHDIITSSPTIFRYRSIAPLEDQPRPTATILDQLDGTCVLHVLCALSIDLKDFISHLKSEGATLLQQPAKQHYEVVRKEEIQGD